MSETPTPGDGLLSAEEKRQYIAEIQSAIDSVSLKEPTLEEPTIEAKPTDKYSVELTLDYRENPDHPYLRFMFTGGILDIMYDGQSPTGYSIFSLDGTPRERLEETRDERLKMLYDGVKRMAEKKRTLTPKEGTTIGFTRPLFVIDKDDKGTVLTYKIGGEYYEDEFHPYIRIKDWDISEIIRFHTALGEWQKMLGEGVFGPCITSAMRQIFDKKPQESRLKGLEGEHTIIQFPKNGQDPQS